MEKERLIAKFKDYSKELEKILVNKPFSKTVKNLLLSMLYKISNSYEDYRKTKVEVPTKNDFLQEILNIISNDCKYIDIIEPKLENDIIEYNESKVINDRIITYQNELSVLEQIYRLNSNKFKVEVDNKIIATALSNLLNKGEEANKSEVIRDFDGWSWNTLENYNHFNISTLLYAGITYLIGYDNLYKNKTVNIETLEKILKEKYKQTIAEKLIKNICQIAIIDYIQDNPNEKTNILQIKEETKKELELISNKKEYIEDMTIQKKECIVECEKIKEFLNNDLLLKKEYIRQNEKLPQEERVFSLSDFSEKIQKQKDELEQKIQELTGKLKPRNFVKYKNKIEKEYSFYSDIDFENVKTIDFIEEFVNLLLKALTIEINKTTTKKEIIEKIYIIRYLNLFNLEDKKLGEVYKKQFNKTQKNLITVGCNLKALTIFSKDVEENYLIYKRIFETRIIDLDNLYIEVTKGNTVKIYDDESVERENNYNIFKDLIIKYNKRYKIFYKV